MDSILSWSERLSVRIPKVDSQHKYLITLCNELYSQLLRIHDAPKRDGAEETMDDNTPAHKYQVFMEYALKKSGEYALIHFKTEEALFKFTNYPEADRHKTIHDNFITEVLKYNTMVSKASFYTCMQLVQFIYEWILEHIAYEDKKYVYHILSAAKNRTESNKI